MSNLIENVLQDLRFAMRTLVGAPTFTCAVVLSLALGIGVSTAVFTVANAVLLRRLPFRSQDRIVVIWPDTRDHRPGGRPLGLQTAQAFGEQAHSLERVAFFSYYGATDEPLREGERVSRLRKAQVSGEFFNVLGAQPTMGRALLPSDDVVGAAPVIVLSYVAWQRQFAADAQIIGRRVQTYNDGTIHTVVGVMPQGFDFPKGVDYWMPLIPSTPARDASFIALDVIGRLRPEASIGSARDDMTAFLDRPDAPSWQHGLRGVVHTLPELILGDTKPALVAFAAAAGLLLLITCINVANLLLVRGLARSREVAVRAALGANRSRIFLQLLVENVLLAIAGGGLGIAVAAFVVKYFVSIAPADLPRLSEIQINTATLGVAIAITVLSVLAFGLAPSLATARVNFQHDLRSDGRQSAGRRRRVATELLVTIQVALALVVLSSAALVSRSLINLQTAKMGLDPTNLLIGEMAAASGRFDTEAKQLALLDRLLANLQGMPGVRSVSPVVAVPFSGSHGWDGRPSAEGQSDAESATDPMLNMEVVAPSYFATVGIPILRGRGFSDSDREGTRPVVIISESAARHYWRSIDSIGKQVFMGPNRSDTMTVIGVVPDTRYRDLREARPTIYFPLHQSTFPFAPMTLVIRTTGLPNEIVPAVRKAIMATDPSVTLLSAASFDGYLAAPLAQPRLNALLLGAFAAASVALALVGLVGVITTMIRQRAFEFGVRMALGAGPHELHRLVVWRGLGIAVPGVAIGLIGSVLLNRALAAMLYQVNPTDAVTLISVGLLLISVSILACLVPAVASSRIDPTSALRGGG